jgi:hypothetical protein
MTAGLALRIARGGALFVAVDDEEFRPHGLDACAGRDQQRLERRSSVDGLSGSSTGSCLSPDTAALRGCSVTTCSRAVRAVPQRAR